MKDFDMLKVSKCASTHTRQKILRNQDYKQAKSWIISELIESKYTKMLVVVIG